MLSSNLRTHTHVYIHTFMHHQWLLLLLHLLQKVIKTTNCCCPKKKTNDSSSTPRNAACTAIVKLFLKRLHRRFVLGFFCYSEFCLYLFCVRSFVSYYRAYEISIIRSLKATALRTKRKSTKYVSGHTIPYQTRPGQALALVIRGRVIVEVKGPPLTIPQSMWESICEAQARLDMNAEACRCRVNEEIHSYIVGVIVGRFVQQHLGGECVHSFQWTGFPFWKSLFFFFLKNICNIGYNYLFYLVIL